MRLGFGPAYGDGFSSAKGNSGGNRSVRESPPDTVFDACGERQPVGPGESLMTRSRRYGPMLRDLQVRVDANQSTRFVSFFQPSVGVIH